LKAGEILTPDPRASEHDGKVIYCIAKTLKRRSKKQEAEVAGAHFVRSFGENVLPLYDQAGMALIALFASHTALSNSSYALGLENNSLRQVRIGWRESAMTEQRVEFPVVIFAH